MKGLRSLASLLALLLCVTFVTSCASTPDPVTCAQIGVGLGAAGGAVGGAKSEKGPDAGPTIGYGILGAVVGGAGGYLLCKLLEEEEEPAPEPKPAPPPPPEPKPAPVPEPDPCAQVIRLRGVNFDFDKATIRSDASVILDEAALLLDEALAECPSRRVAVEGHTDWTGPESYNQSLSERRAAAVRDYLAGKGIDPGQLSTVGHGESQPIASNENREGRALNRRVELRMVQ